MKDRIADGVVHCGDCEAGFSLIINGQANYICEFCGRHIAFEVARDLLTTLVDNARRLHEKDLTLSGALTRLDSIITEARELLEVIQPQEEA